MRELYRAQNFCCELSVKASQRCGCVRETAQRRSAKSAHQSLCFTGPKYVPSSVTHTQKTSSENRTGANHVNSCEKLAETQPASRRSLARKSESRQRLRRQQRRRHRQPRISSTRRCICPTRFRIGLVAWLRRDRNHRPRESSLTKTEADESGKRIMRVFVFAALSSMITSPQRTRMRMSLQMCVTISARGARLGQASSRFSVVYSIRANWKQLNVRLWQEVIASR